MVCASLVDSNAPKSGSFLWSYGAMPPSTEHASNDGLAPTLMGAVQAAVSVLLTIFYGVLAGQMGILDDHSTSQISHLCVRMFLPALLITNVGAELNPGNVDRYGIIVGMS